MFSLRDFIKQGLLDAVGKMADYQIILNAAGWFEKGVLTQEDLAEIQSAIDAKNNPPVAEETSTESSKNTDDSAEEQTPVETGVEE